MNNYLEDSLDTTELLTPKYLMMTTLYKLINLIWRLCSMT